ncbi:MAG: FAD-dependent oxidoreductase [Desulfobacterales bacterium]|nr:FAD-dependent oxidoreductase [Desulfobacterales bacterium]MDD4393758.1 FAD-dependent oxidoreductase [Desulfobacterales bacterium]
MKKHLVIAGTGHAHLTLLKRLQAITGMGHRVTAINPGPWHYYSGMGPGLLSGRYQPRQARFNTMKMVQDRGGQFIEGSVIRIDPDKRHLMLHTGKIISYDIVSFNTGSYIPVEGDIYGSNHVYPAKPIERLIDARQAIETRFKKNQPIHIVVAGGGAAGVEISANIRRLANRAPTHVTIHLIAGRRLLGRFNEKVRYHALGSLTARHIHVIEQARLKKIHAHSVELTDGSILSADMVFMATGTRPSSFFRDSGLPVGNDGGLLVNDYLQCITRPEIFGGGDCICFNSMPLPGIGVYAVRQNPILFHNIVASLTHGTYKPFTPQKTYMLILNMGDGTGIFFRNSWVWKSKLALLLKHLIDSRFVKSFQLSGEGRDR